MAAVATDTIRSRALVIGGGVGIALVTGTLVLWAYYGTAVFFEMVRAGWAACF